MKIGFKTKGLSRKLEKIPAIYKTIITLVLAALVLAALFYVFAKPKWEEREQLKKEYSQLQQELNKLQQIKNNLEKHRREYQLLQEQLQDSLRVLPETKDIPNLLRNITSVSEGTRLKIKFFEPKAIKQKEFYSELPFDIKFSGPFTSVASFLDDVRKLERLVNVTNFSLEAKGTSRNVILEGSCSANAYVYSKAQPKAQKTDPKKAGKK